MGLIKRVIGIITQIRGARGMDYVSFFGRSNTREN